MSKRQDQAQSPWVACGIQNGPTMGLCKPSSNVVGSFFLEGIGSGLVKRCPSLWNLDSLVPMSSQQIELLEDLLYLLDEPIEALELGVCFLAIGGQGPTGQGIGEPFESV